MEWDVFYELEIMWMINTFEYDVSFDLGWREVGVEELCTKIKDQKNGKNWLK